MGPGAASMARAEAGPPRISSGASRVRFVLNAVALVGGVLILAAIAVPSLLRVTSGHGRMGCLNNLSQLWKMESNYIVQYGGLKLLPLETGGEFWLKLSRTEPPLIDATLKEIYACPIKGTPPAADLTDYRGPASNVNACADGDVVGADREGNHGPREGGNVLRRSGDVLTVPIDDVLWREAAVRTKP